MMHHVLMLVGILVMLRWNAQHLTRINHVWVLDAVGPDDGGNRCVVFHGDVAKRVSALHDVFDH